jgi:methyl-accepting chemotaxis protein
MKEVFRTSHEFGPLRESAEWTKRVVRDAGAPHGFLRTWFDGGGAARKVPRATEPVPNTINRRAGPSSTSFSQAAQALVLPGREQMRLPGSTFIASRTIGTRLDWATATALAIIAVMLLSAFVVMTRRADSARTAELRIAVETATAIAAAYEREERSGRLTHAVAQGAALSAISAIRYRGGAYILITDPHPRMVMHPITPERDGSDLTDVLTPDGKPVFVALVNAVHGGGAGVVDYTWSRQGASAPVRRRAYARAFPPWDWVLSGSDDIDDLAAARWRLAMVLLSIGAVASAVIGLVVGRAGRAIARPIRELAAVTEMLSHGNLSVHIACTDRRDELGVLADALRTLKRNAIDRARIVRVGLEERAAKERRQAAMDSLTRDFSEAFSGVLGRLSQTARQISGMARTIANGSGRAHDHVTRAADEWTEAARDLTAMASGLAELSAILGAVNRQATEAVGGDARVAPRHLALIVESTAAAGQKLSVLAARAESLARDARTEAGSFAGETLGLSDSAATASDSLGEVVEALRDEVDQFVMTLVQGESLRRRYERVSGNGMAATLIVPGGPRIPVVVQDLSRGGAALLSAFQGAVGDAVLVALADPEEPLSARVVRHNAGVVAVAFRQDPRTMAAVDAVLDMLMREASEVPAA